LSKFNLKAVLLHNGNIHLSILSIHSVHVKETYENMDLLLKAISYWKYGWKICGDVKDLGLLLGMESVYTKFYCFLREGWRPRKRQTLQNEGLAHARKLSSRGKSVRNQLTVHKDTV